MELRFETARVRHERRGGEERIVGIICDLYLVVEVMAGSKDKPRGRPAAMEFNRAGVQGTRLRIVISMTSKNQAE